MLDDRTVAVVVPAYNVAVQLPRVLATMPAFVDRVIVVDDGSTDATRTIASDFPGGSVTVEHHAHNRGVGAAIVTGYLAALAHGADVVAVMAGDAQMHPDDLAAVVAPVVRDEADYAKGNRLRHDGCRGAMPAVRYVGNVVLSALTRVATGLRHVGDSQCGYTAISGRVLRALDVAAMWPRYGYPNHLLGALAVRGFRVTDVTVRALYADERSGIRWRDALVTVPRILVAVARARYLARVGELPGGFVEVR